MFRFFSTQKTSMESALAQLKSAASHSDVNVELLSRLLSELRAKGEDEGIQFVDVRERNEVATASVPGFQNLPLSESSAWASSITTKLNPDALTLVMCHHGARSNRMCHFLRQQNFKDVRNISGGIDQYSKYDTTVPRY